MMRECIQCGNVQLEEVTCDTCGGATIPALDKAAAGEQVLNRMDHMGLRYTGEERANLLKLIIST